MTGPCQAQTSGIPVGTDRQFGGVAGSRRSAGRAALGLGTVRLRNRERVMQTPTGHGQLSPHDPEPAKPVSPPSPGFPEGGRGS